MRRVVACIFVLTSIMSAPGCLAVGNGLNGNHPTIADEIRELEELRDEGRINHQQCQAGVNRLLYGQ